MTGLMNEASLFQGIIPEGESIPDGNEEFPEGGMGAGLTQEGTYGVGVGVGTVTG